MTFQDDAHLEGLTGELKGREFNLIDGDTTIGRGKENIIQVLDPKASRAHAVIRFEYGRYTLEDLGSSGGTRVNGELVSTAELQNDDTITIGETTFKVHNVVDIESAATIMADEDAPTMLADEDALSTVMAPPVHAIAAETTSCRTCGAQLGHEEKFCGECGTPRERPPAPVRVAPAVPQSKIPVPAPPSTPPPVPPPPAPVIGDAGVQTTDGVIEKLPMKWIGIGCGALVIITICIVLSIFAVGFFSPEESVAEPSPQIELAPPDTVEATPEVEATLPPTAAPDVTSEPPPEVTATEEGSSPPPASDGRSRREVAYASDRTGVAQIYLVDVETGEERQLTNMAEGACQPTFSPDGLRMVITSGCRQNKGEYPGSSLFLIVFDEADQPSEPEALPSSLGGGDYDPDWTLDGDLLVFTSLRTTRPQIFTMDLSGAAPFNVNDDLAYNWEPSWSPDGTQIAFVTTRGGVREIWLVPSSGGSETRFIRSDGKDMAHPDWSPDGSTVLFEKVVGAIPRLVGAPVAESGLREILVCQEGTLSVQPMSEPDWSPDGDWIAFETWPDGVDHNIAIMTAACSQYRELTNSLALDFDAVWRPGP